MCNFHCQVVKFYGPPRHLAALVESQTSLPPSSCHPVIPEFDTSAANPCTVLPLDENYRQRIEAANRTLAENGMRVLGIAFRVQADPTPSETALTFIGFAGIIDPPRPEVKTAVVMCKSAGIRPVMLTGDHPLTALHIARNLGIADASSYAKTGVDLARMSAEVLDTVVDTVTLYARVSPEHKLRIVDAPRRRGQIVAMTGDGVNDGPALKQADIGVAMGITGTDVSKEAADMVLRDDNFSTIVAAVEEGRVLYDNLRKFIKFSIGGNVGKILAVVGVCKHEPGSDAGFFAVCCPFLCGLRL